MAKNLPWFRLYAEIIDDEKIRLLAFEDRWHYIAILSMKGSGLLDSGDSKDLLMRKVSVKMGLASREVDEVARRLADVGLVDKDSLQPLAWNERQFKSDSSNERVKSYRERQKKQQVTTKKRECNVTVTVQDTDTDTDKHKKLLSSDDDAGSVKVKKNHLTTAQCQLIVDQYNERLSDELPAVQMLNKKRESAIRARYSEMVNTVGANRKTRFTNFDEGVIWFGRVFAKAKMKTHWMGENDQNWKANFDWLMTPSRFTELIEFVPPRKE